MIRLEFLVCVLVLCAQIGNIHGQTCGPTDCEASYFDSDLTLDPVQACYTDGSQVDFTCAGTQGGPSGPYTCTIGLWGLPSPSCLVAYCDPPAVETGVTVTPGKDNYTAGEIVTYGCPVGEAIAGPTSAVCEVGGWNPLTLPNCQARCDVPSITNGNLTSDGPFNDGDTATAQCYPGYDLGPGDTTSLNCVGSSWDAIPTCYAKCTVPAIANSDSPVESEITHSSSVNIDCNNGYSNNQETRFPVTCNDGRLEGTVPTQCYQDCSVLIGPTDGSTTGGNLHGQTTVYTCNRGFLLNDTMSETCNDGTWSGGESTPTCYDQSLDNSITLICNTGHFIVEIPLGLFDHDTAGTGSVMMGGCPGTYKDTDYIYINSTYTSCGTILTVNSVTELLLYTNVVTNADNSGESPITTVGALVINIECAFDQDNLVSSSDVMQSTLMKDLDGDSKYSLFFGVFADAGYITPITDTDYVDTNSAIFLKAQVNKVQELNVFPTLCYATPTASPNDTLFFTLITAGVSDTEFATGLSDVDVDSKPTFAFQSKAFRFSNNPSQSIYIHCDLKICPDNACFLPSARRRRSTRNAQLTISKHVLAGPIKTRQTREADVASTWQMTALTVYSATLSVFVVCVIGLFVGMIVYRRRPSKKINNFEDTQQFIDQ